MARAVASGVQAVHTVFCLGRARRSGRILAADPVRLSRTRRRHAAARADRVISRGRSLVGAFVGSFIVGFVYTFGRARADLAYVNPVPAMIFVIAFVARLFGRRGMSRTGWIVLALALVALPGLRASLRQPVGQILIAAIFARA